MKKIAIVTDSNSGITQQQGKDMGIFVIPMPFFIDVALNDFNFFEQAKQYSGTWFSIFHSIVKRLSELEKAYDITSATCGI